jgi:hypothetical protein
MIGERRKKKKKKKGSKGILRCPHHYNILSIALVSTGVYIHTNALRNATVTTRGTGTETKFS